MTKPTLANTLRSLAKHGRKGFYEGPVAEAIVEVVSNLGGQLTLEDLKNHGDMGSELVDAISLKFGAFGVEESQKASDKPDTKGAVEIWEHPPNGQGIVALMALGILQELEKMGRIPTFKEQDHNSPE